RRRALWSSCPMRRPPPRSRLFPYTTLFRSLGALLVGAAEVERGLAWERAPARLHRDREVAAAHELGVTRRHDEAERRGRRERLGDRKSTRLNSSHVKISYAVFCLKKKSSQL